MEHLQERQIALPNFRALSNWQNGPNGITTERPAAGDSRAVGRADLLTAVMHEIGHVLGLDHSGDSTNIMHETLSLGTRRLPTALDAAAADYLFYKWQAERRERTAA